MELGRSAAAAAAATADPSAGCRQGSGPFQRAARLWEGQGGWSLWGWVVQVVEEVVSIAVAVVVLRDVGLLGG